MTPPPHAQGLLICERVIVDRDTGNPSCIGAFTHLDSTDFPIQSPTFYAFSSLTSGRGSGIMKLTITDLHDLQTLADYPFSIEFDDRFSTIHFNLRIADWVYPWPGSYAFELFVDDDLIAQTTVTIEEREL
jgi:hypothetical protein